jgi:hypothetical protein
MLICHQEPPMGCYTHLEALLHFDTVHELMPLAHDVAAMNSNENIDCQHGKVG